MADYLATVDRPPTPFGWFLMAKMEEAGLSQTDLADASGVAQATISRWILNPGMPNPGKLRLVAPHIHVTYEELMARAGHGTPADAATMPAVRMAMPAIVERLNALLGPGSPLTKQNRRDLERVVTGLIAQYEGVVDPPARTG